MGLPPPGQVLYPRNPTRPGTAVISRIDPRAAAVSALAQYLRDAKFVKWGAEAPDIKFQLTAVHEEWADPSKTLDYPVAGIIDASPTAMEPSRLTPEPLEETLDLFGKGTVLWKLAEVSQLMQVDFYTESAPDREAIAAALPGLFAPGEDTSRVVLTGHPKHYGTPVRCSLESYRRMDTDGQVYESERRLMARIWCDVDVVELRCARPLILQARVEVEYPETFALQTVQTVQIEASQVLLDYTQATFTRNSEGAFIDPRSDWAFQGVTEFENWPGINISRIFADGSILIEGETFNILPRGMDLVGWIGSATRTGGQAAPDASTTAFEITDLSPTAGSGASGISPAVTSGAYVYTAFIKKRAASPPFPNLPAFQNPATLIHSTQVDLVTGAYASTVSTGFTGTSVDVFDAGTWWRVVLRFTTSAAIPIQAGFLPAFSSTLTGPGDDSLTGSITIWSPEIYLGLDVSSPVRNFSTSTTRAAEFATLPDAQVPSAFRSGRWRVTLAPTWASAYPPASLAYVYHFDPNNYLAFVSGTTLRLRANGIDHDLTLGAFLAATTFDVAVDFTGGSFSVDGIGSVALGTDWSFGGDDLAIGSSGSADHLFGVIGQPVT